MGGGSETVGGKSERCVNRQEEALWSGWKIAPPRVLPSSGFCTTGWPVESTAGAECQWHASVIVSPDSNKVQGSASRSP